MQMKALATALVLTLALATPLGGCSSGRTVHYIDKAELEAARTELHQAQTAITSCLYEAGRSQLDSPARAWDGGPDQVTCTAGAQTYDAADYLHVAVFGARYDVDVNGVITRGRNVSWLGVRWDPAARQWAPL